MRTSIYSFTHVNRIAIAILTVLSVFSCSNPSFENDGYSKKSVTILLTENEANALKIKKTGYYLIPKEEAIKKVINQYYSYNNTDGDNITVASCKKIDFAKNRTRVGDPGCSGIYIMELSSKTNKGFAIVSADRRVDEILAVSEKGSLNDTIFNEGLKTFYNGMKTYLQNKINEFNTDSLYNAVLTKSLSTRNGWIDDGCSHYLFVPNSFIPDPDFEYTGEETITSECHNRGTILTTQWSQTYPYNNKLPFVAPNQRAYAGCSIIAIAQIMGYHKLNYGSTIRSDWESFTQAPQCYDEKLQDCILRIFNNIRKEASINGTSVYRQEVASFLNQNGYNAELIKQYDSSRMTLPAIVHGTNSKNEGHAWIIDSQKRYAYTTYDVYFKDDGYDFWYVYIEKHGEYGKLNVHCNWGWGGSSDGWYLDKVFASHDKFNFSNKLQMTIVKPK